MTRLCAKARQCNEGLQLDWPACEAVLLSSRPALR
jgi:hypothetical protein